MERETMRSITDWLFEASAHHEPVPSQVTAAGSCAQVTRPGTTPRGTPSGESGEANSEEGSVLAAATDRANCRRVISIESYSSTCGIRWWRNSFHQLLNTGQFASCGPICGVGLGPLAVKIRCISSLRG